VEEPPPEVELLPQAAGELQVLAEARVAQAVLVAPAEAALAEVVGVEAVGLVIP
jgi:hypothetical protein